MATITIVSSTHATRGGTGQVTVARPATLQTGDMMLAFQFYKSERTPRILNITGFRNYQTGAYTVSGVSVIVTYFTVYHYTTVVGRTVIIIANTTKRTYKPWSTNFLSWRLTFARYTRFTTPASWNTAATFVVVVGIRFPPGATWNIDNFETFQLSTVEASSTSVVFTPELATDLLLLAAIQGTTGKTVTFPAGTTTIASSNSNVSAAVGYLVPGTGRHTESVSMSASGRMQVFGILLTGASGPSRPSLSAPAATAILDVTTGAVFTATYFSTSGAPQNAYAFRIRTSTSLAWQYWNASTSSLQSSIVWNATATTPGKSWSVSVPHTILSNNVQYVWSMASRTSVANRESTFASTLTFTTAVKPIVTVTAPTGADVSTAHPVVRFSWTTAPTFALTSVRVVVYTQAQHTISTFTPGVSPSFWDSGTIA